jgi:tRNA nucleotidyltransferase (CCA-adding enzyme)
MGTAASIPRWETFPHSSDVGLRGCGATLAEAFEQVALALTSVVTDLARVRETTSVPIACSGSDPEVLLYDFVGALVYEMATRRLLFARCSVTIAEGRLTARAFGEPVDVVRHEPAVEVKGPTFTLLEVRQEGPAWRAQLVVDV